MTTTFHHPHNAPWFEPLLQCPENIRKLAACCHLLESSFLQYKGSNGTNNEIILHNDKWAQLKSNELVIMNPVTNISDISCSLYHFCCCTPDKWFLVYKLMFFSCLLFKIVLTVVFNRLIHRLIN